MTNHSAAIRVRSGSFAEFPQGVISRVCAGLNFLGGEIRLRVSREDGFNDAFCTLYHVRWGAQTHATDERVNGREPARVFQCVLHSVNHGSCALADEVGVQLLAMSNFPSHEVFSFVMPLRDPCAYSGSTGASERTKEAGEGGHSSWIPSTTNPSHSSIPHLGCIWH